MVNALQRISQIRFPRRTLATIGAVGTLYGAFAIGQWTSAPRQINVSRDAQAAEIEQALGGNTTLLRYNCATEANPIYRQTSEINEILSDSTEAVRAGYRNNPNFDPATVRAGKGYTCK
jgi:hypothetical protein